MLNSRLSRAPIAITLVIFAALVVGSILAFPSLPERIPQHFGADGEVDRWVQTSWVSWMLLPIVAAAVTALVYGIAAIIPRDISKLNLPNKERLLRLPSDQQLSIVATVRTAMHWIATIVLAVLSLIQVEVYHVARAEANPIALAWLIPIFVVIVFVAVALMYRKLRRHGEVPFA